MTEQAVPAEWAIVELLGHRRLAGRISEETRFGAVLLRLDVPIGEAWQTQYYSGAALYALTPCDEATARAVAAHHTPEPVHRWELLPPAGVGAIRAYDEDGVPF
jgi:hypothetical protein